MKQSPPIEDVVQPHLHRTALSEMAITSTPNSENASSAPSATVSVPVEAAPSNTTSSSATCLSPLPFRSDCKVVESEPSSPSTAASTLYEQDLIDSSDGSKSDCISPASPSPPLLATNDTDEPVLCSVYRCTIGDPSSVVQLKPRVQTLETIKKLVILAPTSLQSATPEEFQAPPSVPAPDLSKANEDIAFLNRLLKDIPFFGNLKTLVYDLVGYATTMHNALFECIQQCCAVEHLFLSGSFDCEKSNVPTNFDGFAGPHLLTLNIHYNCKLSGAEGHRCWPKRIASLLHGSPHLQVVYLTGDSGSLSVKSLKLSQLKLSALKILVLAGIDINKHPGDVLEFLAKHPHLHCLDLDHPQLMAVAKEAGTSNLPLTKELAASIHYIKAAVASWKPDSGLRWEPNSLHIRGLRRGGGVDDTFSFLQPHTSNVLSAAITFAPGAACWIDEFALEFKQAFPKATSIAWYTAGDATRIRPKYASEACKWVEPFAAFKGVTTFRPLDLILQYTGLRGPSVDEKVTLEWLRNFAAFIPTLRFIDGSPKPGTTLPYYESVRINQTGNLLSAGWRVDRTLVDRTTGATFEVITPFPPGSRSA